MTRKPSIIVKYQQLTQGYLSNSQTDYVLYEKLKGTQCPAPVKFRVGAKVKPQGPPGTSTAQPYNKKKERYRWAKGPNGWSLSLFPLAWSMPRIIVTPGLLPSSMLMALILYMWVQKRDKVEKSSLSKETMPLVRLEPRPSRSGVWGINSLATHASATRLSYPRCKGQAPGGTRLFKSTSLQ